ncbi:hypothetical protein LCI18_004793 [Fusarium solani-melongenae]|uniref:Uncharacterized protein n=1 Tax=Fusarium solani subsp. cucurbitae TaxID=2747967 RepID=A0ACD3Z174_FUSSC|nr:hypothetical protein LCI18_004793 [Fusarium solani-melongenae]
MSSKCHPNLLTATTGELRRLLDAGECTSVELVNLYLKQIAAHNHDGMKLNAIISTAPLDRVLEEARASDHERREKGPRSRLHGIPIILKDLITTPSFGMGTTSGSFALKGLNACKDAPIATMLRKARCIVIGKANLSEWANAKGFGVTSGWSPVGGQTQSPYVKGGVDPSERWLGHSTPAGSSSGCSVATAAGFAPITIGTEAGGSIVQPAIRAALYRMKGTVGAVNMVGTQSGGAAWDSAGPLAKSVEDCADVMDILLPNRNFHSSLTGSWKGIRIALLNYEDWQFGDEIWHKNPVFDGEHKRDISHAMKTIEDLGGKVVHDAPLLKLGDIVKTYKTAEMGAISRHQLGFVFERYLGLFDDPQLRTLEDLVQFNKKHAEVELPPDQPSQAVLENGLKDNMTNEEYHSSLKHFRQSVRAAVEKLWEETGTDVIMASGDVPLGFSTHNGRPYGMEIVARDGAEDKLFQVMSAWEATFPDGRRPPPLLEKL